MRVEIAFIKSLRLNVVNRIATTSIPYQSDRDLFAFARNHNTTLLSTVITFILSEETQGVLLIFLK